MSQTYESRLRALETEIELSRRKRSDECDKALVILRKITPEHVELLSPIVPEIASLSNVTKEVLMNDDKVYNTIVSIVNRLNDYLEKQLTLYEGNI